jgi:hypothetical protein
MASPPRTSTVGVKNLRAKFEAASARPIALTPEQFFKAQKDAAEREAQAIILARKKAAAFNLAMRQLEISSAHASKPTPSGPLSPTNSTVAATTAPSSTTMMTTNTSPIVDESETRTKLRKEARRLSQVLRTMDEQKEEQRPVLKQQERRATHLLLASMASELEEEMKREQLLDAINEDTSTDDLAASNATAVAAAAAAHQEEAEKKQAMILQEAKVAEEARRQAVEDDERLQIELAKEKARIEKEETAMIHHHQQQQQQQKEEEYQKDRQILQTYLHENYPEKAFQVDQLLQQFAGNLDVLYEELGKGQKFKEVPPSPSGMASLSQLEDDYDDQRTSTSQLGSSTVHTMRDDETVLSPSQMRNEKSFLKPGIDLRTVVTKFYSIYASSKLKDIDDILRHFDQRESDLFRTLEVKYDVTFATDGTCVPNNGDKLGEPFMEASQQPAASHTSKFAVDVQSRTLKDKLAKQGQPLETVNVVMSSGSAMM